MLRGYPLISDVINELLSTVIEYYWLLIVSIDHARVKTTEAIDNMDDWGNHKCLERTEFFTHLSPYTHVQILQADLHTLP